MRVKICFSILLALILALTVLPVYTVRADSIPSVYDIMDAMNQLRTGFGYAALIVDPILMGTAQATAETMAATGNCNHLGDVSGRVTAAGYGRGRQVFATENIVCGMNTLEAIYSAWADDAHMLPATYANYRNIGAGVAQSTEGYYYFVLHAAYIAGGLANPTQDPSKVVARLSATYDVSNYVSSVQTVTPLPNGQVIHVVLAGQSLWSIATAYGVKIADILKLNSLPEKAIIYEGQKLLISLGSTPTVSPTFTATAKPATRTPAPTKTKQPPTRTPSQVPTATPTPAPFLGELGLDRRTLGMMLIVVCVAGLGFVLVGTLRKKK